MDDNMNLIAEAKEHLEGWSGIWWLLGVDGGRDAILASLAGELLLYAGNLRYEMEKETA